jgi:hypothetical protein
MEAGLNKTTEAALSYMSWDWADMIQYYWDVLGREGFAPAFVSAQEAKAASALAMQVTEATLSAGGIAGIVVGTAVVVASLALLLKRLQTLMAKQRTLMGRVLPPGVGPLTTLVITDVQASTWCMLKAIVRRSTVIMQQHAYAQLLQLLLVHIRLPGLCTCTSQDRLMHVHCLITC